MESLNEKGMGVKMKLCGDFDLIDFFKAVTACSQEVRFYSVQGDQLNLKSTLSQYLFTSLAGQSSLLQGGRIECECEEDEKRLEVFFEKGTAVP